MKRTIGFLKRAGLALCLAATAFAQPLEVIGVSRDARGIIVSMAGDIFFEFNRSELTESHKENINGVADVLAAYDNLKIKIEGHSDNIGTAKANLQISKERAESVKNHLVSRGIAADRLTAVGVGFERPIADNKTNEGRARNRRIEMIVDDNAEVFEKLAQAVVKTDTVVVTKVDSVIITKTFIDSVTVTKTQIDTVTVIDTLIIRDTVRVEVTKNVDADIKFISGRIGFMYSPVYEEPDLGMARFLELELGAIMPSGLFVSGVASVGGGNQGKRGTSTGGGLNVGYCFLPDAIFSTVVGGTAGLWNVYQRVDHRGQFSHNENTLSFGGAFWKIMFGKNHNFDITNRMLFGFSERRDYDHATAAYHGSKRDFAMTHSINIGYTFAKKRGE